MITLIKIAVSLLGIGIIWLVIFKGSEKVSKTPEDDSILYDTYHYDEDDYR